VLWHQYLHLEDPCDADEEENIHPCDAEEEENIHPCDAEEEENIHPCDAEEEDVHLKEEEEKVHLKEEKEVHLKEKEEVHLKDEGEIISVQVDVGLVIREYQEKLDIQKVLAKKLTNLELLIH